MAMSPMSCSRTDEADAAHVEGLLAQREPLAADVLVGVGNGGLQLGQRHAVPAQPVGIDLDVVLLGQRRRSRPRR